MINLTLVRGPRILQIPIRTFQRGNWPTRGGKAVAATCRFGCGAAREISLARLPISRPSALSGARHRAGWQLRDVRRDLTWLGQPDLVPVVEDVLHGTSELPQVEWVAEDKGVQHEWADQ